MSAQWTRRSWLRTHGHGDRPVDQRRHVRRGPQDAGVASATVTVGQQLGASIGTSLLNTIFAAAVTAYITAHLTTAALIGRRALTGLALAHGYDTAFWWIAGIFAGGAVVGGALLRRGPLGQNRAPSPARDGVVTAQAKSSEERVR